MVVVGDDDYDATMLPNRDLFLSPHPPSSSHRKPILCFFLPRHHLPVGGWDLWSASEGKDQEATRGVALGQNIGDGVGDGFQISGLQLDFAILRWIFQICHLRTRKQSIY
ncbi:unnamed protein product [Linum trigynum]|uniref:Uncharacterized protein n=1 Tax=Linum trigynum TaxID=586398 RepID=A0AAV2FG22_9ROSI